jgi:hypothetical protein
MTMRIHFLWKRCEIAVFPTFSARELRFPVPLHIGMSVDHSNAGRINSTLPTVPAKLPLLKIDYLKCDRTLAMVNHCTSIFNGPVR